MSFSDNPSEMQMPHNRYSDPQEAQLLEGTVKSLDKLHDYRIGDEGSSHHAPSTVSTDEEISSPVLIRVSNKTF